MKRFFDIICSFFGLIFLSPLFLLISILIRFDSKGTVFYKQLRVGKNGKDFQLYKFRTMVEDADKKGDITTSDKDSRITHIGRFLRKHKFDEFPQLLNVLKGEMSLVGPRPELRKYVEMYREEQKNVLSVLPGITDYASLKFSNENELLGKAENPQEYYIRQIMPVKLKLNLKYIEDRGFFTDLKIIFATLKKIL
ncbi:MAG: glycosyl transferase [Flavobacteriales bacterium]|nr:MAG: glycosyl transferase [Flavobacteriales bacterium]